MAKTYKIEGTFDKRDDVKIAVTETVTPVPVVRTRDLTVFDIEHRIEAIESDLVTLAAEKADLEKILDDNEQAITNATR